MQFNEPKSTTGECPVCHKPVIRRTTRGGVNFCSRVCASAPKYAQRYRGSSSGPLDRPTMVSKTKLV